MTNVQLSEAEIAAISGLLKSARESRGDNLAEAAFKIALSPSQLRAIEAGDLQPFYSTGYYLQAVDRYANYLGVTLPPRVPPATEVPEAVAQEAPESDAVASDAVPSDAAPSDALVAEMPTTVSTVMEAEPKKVGISELPSERESRTVPWGWIAFAIAGLIRPRSPRQLRTTLPQAMQLPMRISRPIPQPRPATNPLQQQRQQHQ
jgi:transcriptional regulator with XRE-family HTH domain